MSWGPPARKRISLELNELGLVGLFAQNADPCKAALSRLADAVERMGLLVRDGPARQVQVRLSREEIDYLVLDYESGSTVDDLAERYGINRTTVRGHLRREGVQTRRKLRKLNDNQVDRAARE